MTLSVSFSNSGGDISLTPVERDSRKSFLACARCDSPFKTHFTATLASITLSVTVVSAFRHESVEWFLLNRFFVWIPSPQYHTHGGPTLPFEPLSFCFPWRDEGQSSSIGYSTGWVVPVVLVRAVSPPVVLFFLKLLCLLSSATSIFVLPRSCLLVQYSYCFHVHYSMLFQGWKKQGLVNIIRVFIYLFKTFSYLRGHFTSTCSSEEGLMRFPTTLRKLLGLLFETVFCDNCAMIGVLLPARLLIMIITLFLHLIPPRIK